MADTIRDLIRQRHASTLGSAAPKPAPTVTYVPGRAYRPDPFAFRGGTHSSGYATSYPGSRSRFSDSALDDIPEPTSRSALDDRRGPSRSFGPWSGLPNDRLDDIGRTPVKSGVDITRRELNDIVDEVAKAIAPILDKHATVLVALGWSDVRAGIKEVISDAITTHGRRYVGGFPEKLNVVENPVVVKRHHYECNVCGSVWTVDAITCGGMVCHECGDGFSEIVGVSDIPAHEDSKVGPQLVSGPVDPKTKQQEDQSTSGIPEV